MRILDVVYNATSNELVRTKTLTKNTIVQIDAQPFKQWRAAAAASGFTHSGGEVGRSSGVAALPRAENVGDRAIGTTVS